VSKFLITCTITVADQAWVTHAYDEKSALKVLVLLKSLRRLLTSKKIVVLVAENGVRTTLRYDIFINASYKLQKIYIIFYSI
jgi:hypothetical protein